MPARYPAASQGVLDPAGLPAQAGSFGVVEARAVGRGPQPGQLPGHRHVGRPIKPTELADLTTVERPTTSRNLAVMQTRGWVTTADVSPAGRRWQYHHRRSPAARRGPHRLGAGAGTHPPRPRPRRSSCPRPVDSRTSPHRPLSGGGPCTRRCRCRHRRRGRRAGRTGLAGPVGRWSTPGPTHRRNTAANYRVSRTSTATADQLSSAVVEDAKPLDRVCPPSPRPSNRTAATRPRTPSIEICGAGISRSGRACRAARHEQDRAGPRRRRATSSPCRS